MSQRLRDLVLLEGLDDWVPLAAVEGFARQLGTADSEQPWIEDVRHLAEEGLVTLGSVTDEGFSPFHEPLSTSIERIREATRTTTRPEWGFMCWLANTPAGNEAAVSLRS